MSGFPSYDSFMTDMSKVSATAEIYRKKGLVLFACGCVAAVFLASAGLVFPVEIVQAMDLDEGRPGDQDELWLVLLFSILCLVLAIVAVLLPVMSYRGSNRSSGQASGTISLKDRIYSEIMLSFGGFKFAAGGGYFLTEAKRATILPEHDVAVTEDYIEGSLHLSHIQMAEVRCLRLQESERRAVFRGLVVLIDFVNMGLKLRRNFLGRTVLIADGQKNLPGLSAAFSSLQTVALPTSRLEALLEAYASDAEEARGLLNASLLETLSELAVFLGNLKQQETHWDTQLAHMGHALLHRLKHAGAKSPERPFDYILSAEDAEALQLFKNEPAHAGEDSILYQVRLEFFEDKALLLVPCPHDLFETNSLFEPALNREDAEILYRIMKAVDQLTRDTASYLSNVS